MEGEEVMVNGWVANGAGVVPFGNGLQEVCNENVLVPGDDVEKVEFLADLEEYWDDISDRLTISQMVSNSLIKGMVTAVEQETAERIAAKQMEVADLKEYLQSHGVGIDKYKDVRLPVVEKANGVGKSGTFSCSPDACKKHEEKWKDLNSLKDLAREQFKKVKKEIEFARGSNSLKKIGSGSELLGLGGILHEKQSESWMHVNMMLDSLKITVDAVCQTANDISFSDSQQDLPLLSTTVDVVEQNTHRSSQKEDEESSLVPMAQIFGVQNTWLEKFNNISSLGTKLDAILKSLCMSESELVSNGSHDLDHLHHKASGNHVTPIGQYGENGIIDALNIHVAESYDFQQLKHMTKEELVDYFNDIITKMKRDHESALHQKTEDYFRLKREYLREKRSFTKHRKDDEFDVLRKKIPEVILKLEDFLSENERFPLLTNLLESIGILKHRLESLQSENHDLSECLTYKENEVKCLEAQVSDAGAAEEHMLKGVENLKSAMEDSHIEASVINEVYKCALREQIAQMNWDSEDSRVEFLVMQEIYDAILREASIPAETAKGYGFDDSDFESLIMQELNGLLLTEAFRDFRLQLDDLCWKVLIDKDIRVFLENKVIEKENELKLEIEGKEELKQEIQNLQTAVEEKEKFVMDLSVSLSREKEQFEVASQELVSLREHASQQQTTAIESIKDMESIRPHHLKALEQIEVDKMEMLELNQKLYQTKVALGEASKERDNLLLPKKCKVQ